MDFTTITTAISTVGFPIVAFVMVYKTMNDNNKAHKEETENLTKSINDLRVVMARILEKLGGGKDETEK